MVEADIVVSSTGCPHTILHRADVAKVMSARRNRPLVLVDIAVPRDIAADVQRLDNVYLYDVDDLELIVRENVRNREQELARCRHIIMKHTREVVERFGERPAEAGRRAVSSRPGCVLLEPAVCSG
jgi:glutamyl-tRNA reductase